MAIFKVMIYELFNKVDELLNALDISQWATREWESDYSRYLVDMYNYSLRYAYKK